MLCNRGIAVIATLLSIQNSSAEDRFFTPAPAKIAYLIGQFLGDGQGKKVVKGR
jgi:hypothetical protein